MTLPEPGQSHEQQRTVIFWQEIPSASSTPILGFWVMSLLSMKSGQTSELTQYESDLLLRHIARLSKPSPDWGTMLLMHSLGCCVCEKGKMKQWLDENRFPYRWERFVQSKKPSELSWAMICRLGAGWLGSPDYYYVGGSPRNPVSFPSLLFLSFHNVKKP